MPNKWTRFLPWKRSKVEVTLYVGTLSSSLKGVWKINGREQVKGLFWAFTQACVFVRPLIYFGRKKQRGIQVVLLCNISWLKEWVLEKMNELVPSTITIFEIKNHVCYRPGKRRGPFNWTRVTKEGLYNNVDNLTLHIHIGKSQAVFLTNTYLRSM